MDGGKKLYRDQCCIACEKGTWLHAKTNRCVDCVGEYKGRVYYITIKISYRLDVLIKIPRILRLISHKFSRLEMSSFFG